MFILPFIAGLAFAILACNGLCTGQDAVAYIYAFIAFIPALFGVSMIITSRLMKVNPSIALIFFAISLLVVGLVLSRRFDIFNYIMPVLIFIGLGGLYAYTSRIK